MGILDGRVAICTGSPDLADDVGLPEHVLAGVDQSRSLLGVFVVQIARSCPGGSLDDDVKLGLHQCGDLSGNESGSTFSGEAFSGYPNNLPGNILRHASILRQILSLEGARHSIWPDNRNRTKW